MLSADAELLNEQHSHRIYGQLCVLFRGVNDRDKVCDEKKNVI